MTRIRLLALPIVAAAVFISCTPPTTTLPGGVVVVDKNYASPSCPAASYVYRFTPQLSLDVYPRIGTDNRGTIVFVHGGGLTSGDRRGGGGACGTLGMGALLAQRNRGWDLVSIDYRLVTSDLGTKFPGSLIDVSEAVKWAKGLGGQLAGINGSRIVVAGHSAGGTLAALMGAYNNTTALGNAFPAINGWMAISAPLEYGADPAYTTQLGNPPASSNDLFVNWWSGNVFSLQLTQAIPEDNFNGGSARGYLIHGQNDPLIRIKHSEAMKAKADAVGVSVEFDRVTSAVNDSDHFAIGGADYTKLCSWFDSM